MSIIFSLFSSNSSWFIVIEPSLSCSFNNFNSGCLKDFKSNVWSNSPNFFNKSTELLSTVSSSLIFSISIAISSIKPSSSTSNISVLSSLTKSIGFLTIWLILEKFWIVGWTSLDFSLTSSFWLISSSKFSLISSDFLELL